MAGWTLICSVLLYSLLQISATQTSCTGRCGEPFSRGKTCTCDADCLIHAECCKDYENVCTTRGSCRGRCQEAFRRGRGCECDPDCALYNTCCPDYITHCDVVQVMRSTNQVKPAGCAPGGVTLTIAGGEPAREMFADGAGPSVLDGTGQLMPLTADLLQPTAGPHDAGLYLPHPAPNAAHHTPGLHSPQPGASIPGQPLHVMTFPITGHAAGVPAEVPAVSDLLAGGPSILSDVAQALGVGDPAALPNESSNPDLCNGPPIDGLAAPFNGSIIVFRGHFFWLLDPKTREAGPARSITVELGIPSPIDTAFTRCNCQGKTYIIKGDSYWVFEKGVMEPGYPRSVSSDFGGLSGEVVAALPVPANRKRPEAVYFFKNDGTAQKLTYPAGSGPSCNGKKAKNSSAAKNQPEARLSGEINIGLKWKGFPTPVTSAFSMPNPRKPDGFEHFVFSGSKVLNIKVSGENPALVTPAKPSAEQNDVRAWLGCP